MMNKEPNGGDEEFTVEELALLASLDFPTPPYIPVREEKP